LGFIVTVFLTADKIIENSVEIETFGPETKNLEFKHRFVISVLYILHVHVFNFFTTYRPHVVEFITTSPHSSSLNEVKELSTFAKIIIKLESFSGPKSQSLHCVEPSIYLAHQRSRKQATIVLCTFVAEENDDRAFCC